MKSENVIKNGKYKLYTQSRSIQVNMDKTGYFIKIATDNNLNCIPSNIRYDIT